MSFTRGKRTDAKKGALIIITDTPFLTTSAPTCGQQCHQDHDRGIGRQRHRQRVCYLFMGTYNCLLSSQTKNWAHGSSFSSQSPDLVGQLFLQELLSICHGPSTCHISPSVLTSSCCGQGFSSTWSRKH